MNLQARILHESINPHIARVSLDFTLFFINFNDMQELFAFDKKYKVCRCRFVA